MRERYAAGAKAREAELCCPMSCGLRTNLEAFLAWAASLDPRALSFPTAPEAYRFLGEGKSAANLKQMRAALSLAYKHWDLKNPFTTIDPPTNRNPRTIFRDVREICSLQLSAVLAEKLLPFVTLCGAWHSQALRLFRRNKHVRRSVSAQNSLTVSYFTPWCIASPNSSSSCPRCIQDTHPPVGVCGCFRSRRREAPYIEFQCMTVFRIIERSFGTSLGEAIKTR